eukprot:TRINITY_DN12272_c4_g1_i1.p1 TRINITY_DN12272_c4_g1~~TRINITY_DN12272_c4_g1_i1.p1  ORF type:complete len:486 (+),score=109.22 TRINITY_DN12272_c4_g1_i1:251-1708(+)
MIGSRQALHDPEELPLRSFLQRCNPDWGPRDLKNVERKLSVIGIKRVGELINTEQKGLLNDFLDAAGERRFNLETLEAISFQGDALRPGQGGVAAKAPLWSQNRPPRPPSIPPIVTSSFTTDMRNSAASPSESSASGSSGCKRSSFTGSLSTNINDADDDDDDDSDVNIAEFEDMLNGFFAKASKATGHRQSQKSSNRGSCKIDFSDLASLRSQVNRGLHFIDEAAAEAHRRNADINRSLEEVQADITRISERMVAARTQRRRGKAAAANAASASLPKATPSSSFTSVPPLDPKWPPVAGLPKAAPGQRRQRGQRYFADRSAPPRTPPAAATRPVASGTYVSASDAYTRKPASRGGIGSRQDSRSGARHGTRAPPQNQEAPSGGPCPRAAQAGFAFGGANNQNRKGQRQEAPLQEFPEPDDGRDIVRQSVRTQMLNMQGRSQEEKRATVKRLLVKWHPDRNPDSAELATSVFQYIQQEKHQLLGV